MPNEVVTINDRDPPWIINKIKRFIKNKTEYLKNCVNPNNPESLRHFEQMQDALRKDIKIIISNFLENLQLVKSILNFTDPY